jgi:RNA polymerase sigma-70 factor, ECF subfamily
VDLALLTQQPVGRITDPGRPGDSTRPVRQLVIRWWAGAVVSVVPVLRAHRRHRTTDLRALADEDLMGLVYDGEARAFEIVFDRHAGPAFSLAYRMCGRRAMAEDIVQDTFLSLWRTGARYDRARGSVRSWVLRAVHNRAIDAFRREAATTSRDVQDEGISAEFASRERTDVEVERRDDARLVRSALDQLPSDQRKVIELAYFGGFSHSEIAETLDLPAGTVKGRMRLGLSKLRSALGEPMETVL